MSKGLLHGFHASLPLLVPILFRITVLYKEQSLREVVFYNKNQGEHNFKLLTLTAPKCMNYLGNPHIALAPETQGCAQHRSFLLYQGWLKNLANVRPPQQRQGCGIGTILQIKPGMRECQ